VKLRIYAPEAQSIAVNSSSLSGHEITNVRDQTLDVPLEELSGLGTLERRPRTGAVYNILEFTGQRFRCEKRERHTTAACGLDSAFLKADCCDQYALVRTDVVEFGMELLNVIDRNAMTIVLALDNHQETGTASDVENEGNVDLDLAAGNATFVILSMEDVNANERREDFLNKPLVIIEISGAHGC
jgi:hypothetical protein